MNSDEITHQLTMLYLQSKSLNTVDRTPEDFAHDYVDISSRIRSILDTSFEEDDSISLDRQERIDALL